MAQLQGRDDTEPRKRVEALAAEFAALTKALAEAQGRLTKSPDMARALETLGLYSTPSTSSRSDST